MYKTAVIEKTVVKTREKPISAVVISNCSEQNLPSLLPCPHCSNKYSAPLIIGYHLNKADEIALEDHKSTSYTDELEMSWSSIEDRCV